MSLLSLMLGLEPLPAVPPVQPVRVYGGCPEGQPGSPVKRHVRPSPVRVAVFLQKHPSASRAEIACGTHIGRVAVSKALAELYRRGLVRASVANPCTRSEAVVFSLAAPLPLSGDKLTSATIAAIAASAE